MLFTPIAGNSFAVAKEDRGLPAVVAGTALVNWMR